MAKEVSTPHFEESIPMYFHGPRMEVIGDFHDKVE